MDKYTLLIIFNAPFILFGVFRAYVSYSKKIISLSGFLIRLVFWGAIFAGLFFAQEIYDFLIARHLTDSTPLSIADVVLLTGITFCLSLIMRLYAKQELTEHELVKLQQELSIRLSEPKTPRRRAKPGA